MIVNEMTKLWNKKKRRKVIRGCFKDYQSNGGASHPFERNSRFLLVWRPHARSLARIVLRGPAPLSLVASLWVAPAFCVASLYDIYSPPPNSFRAVLFRWLEEKGGRCRLPPSPIPRPGWFHRGPATAFARFSHLWSESWLEGKEEIDVPSKRTERKREREWKRKKEVDYVRRERRRARVHLLFVGPLGGPLTAVSLISARWGPPIGHMKAKKPKVVVDLVLHRPLN